MSDASLTLEMLVKEGKAVIGLNNVAQAERRVEQGAAKISKEAKQAEKELDRFAKTTTRINATPIEKYRTQIERLDHALARGKITHETYGRAVARAGSEMEAAGRKQQEAFGSSALGTLGRYAAAYFTISRAVMAAGAAFRHAEEQRQAGLGTMRGLDDERRALAQLAIGEKPGTLTADTKRADQAAMASGAKRDVAMRVLHAAKSMGFEDQYEEVMGAHPILDAAAGGTIAGKVRQMSGGKHSFRTLANMLIEAGKPSEVDAETLAGPMAIALEGGRRIGASAEETMSLLSAATVNYAGRGEDQGEGKSGSARVAGDRMRAFAHKVATRRPDLAGKGLFAAFEGVRGLNDVERGEFLQENEEIASIYEVYLQVREQAQRTLANVQRAGATPADSDNVSQGLAIRAADPASQAAVELTRAENAKDIALEDAYAVTEAQRETVKNRLTGAGAKSGLGIMQRFGAKVGMGMAGTIEDSPEGVAKAGQGGVGFMNFLQAGALINAGQPLNTAPMLRDMQQRTDQFNEEAVEVLKQIRDGQKGQVGRSISAAAQAPNN